MTNIICERQMPGNIDCRNCGIKQILEKDGWGTYHLSETDARSEGLVIYERPKNAWIGQSRQKTAQCARGENGITAVIDR